MGSDVISTVFEPEEFSPGTTTPFIRDGGGGGGAPTSTSTSWEPLYRQTCVFGPEIFVERMMTFIRNPNLNSSWLFRGDVVYDDGDADADADADGDADGDADADADADGDRYHHPSWPAHRVIEGMARTRTLVRRLIPRNQRRDAPMYQSCEFHRSVPSSPSSSSSSATTTTTTTSTLLLYIPHVASPATMPFYHPKVAGIAHLHEWDAAAGRGAVSIHMQPFDTSPSSSSSSSDTCTENPKLRRVAYHLLERLHKHGTGSLLGYTKRVHHDRVIAQPRFQDRYAQLKARYARPLLESWAESTDPRKHVFEDLGIAAFLMELWADMYGGGGGGSGDDGRFPGFVDIGCGNGLLVHILNEEGYRGWGFDARARRSWAGYGAARQCEASPTGMALAEMCLVPSVVVEAAKDGEEEKTLFMARDKVFDGRLDAGTFIISNHADELTPWTPILAAMSGCPFLSIPCCSHDLRGKRFRAPPPRRRRGRTSGSSSSMSTSTSTYASLVDWVARIAEDCGWEVEMEALRIPSTRNVALLGRRRGRRKGSGGEGEVNGIRDHEGEDETEGGGGGGGEGEEGEGEEEEEVDIQAILARYGGVEGYYANIAKLVKTGSGSSH